MKRCFGILLVLLCACSGADATTSPTAGSIAGTYRLSTMDGSPLPFGFSSGNAMVVVTTDSLIITNDGKWTEAGLYDEMTTDGSTTSEPITDGGVWSQTAGVVSLTRADGSFSYTGNFTGTSLQLTDSIFAMVFAR